MPKMEMGNFTVNPNPKWAIIGKLVKCAVQWEKICQWCGAAFKLGPYFIHYYITYQYLDTCPT
jgi:hypothetical protein